MNDLIKKFKFAIAAAGLTLPTEIVGDGLIDRYCTSWRRSDLSGWYVLHGDKHDISTSIFGCWHGGFTVTRYAKSDKTITPAKLETHWQRIKAMKALRHAHLLAIQQQAGATVLLRFNKVMRSTIHANTFMKGVLCYGVEIGEEGTLLEPIRDTAGTHLTKPVTELRRMLEKSNATRALPNCTTLLARLLCTVPNRWFGRHEK